MSSISFLSLSDDTVRCGTILSDMVQDPGHIIARLRMELGFSQRQAAAAAGINQPSWSRIESGIVSDPRPGTKVRVALALRVEVSDIWPPRPRRPRQEAEDDPSLPSVMEWLLRVEREGSLEERQHAGKWLLGKIEHADPTLREPDSEWGRFPILLRLALSLTIDPETYRPITITDGETEGREVDGLTPVTRTRVGAANVGVRKHRKRA